VISQEINNEDDIHLILIDRYGNIQLREIGEFTTEVKAKKSVESV